MARISKWSKMRKFRKAMRAWTSCTMQTFFFMSKSEMIWARDKGDMTESCLVCRSVLCLRAGNLTTLHGSHCHMAGLPAESFCWKLWMFVESPNTEFQLNMASGVQEPKLQRCLFELIWSADSCNPGAYKQDNSESRFWNKLRTCRYEQNNIVHHLPKNDREILKDTKDMGGIRLGTEPVHPLMAEIPRVLMSCPSFYRLREALKLDVYV